MLRLSLKIRLESPLNRFLTWRPSLPAYLLLNKTSGCCLADFSLRRKNVTAAAVAVVVIVAAVIASSFFLIDCLSHSLKLSGPLRCNPPGYMSSQWPCYVGYTTSH